MRPAIPTRRSRSWRSEGVTLASIDWKPTLDFCLTPDQLAIRDAIATTVRNAFDAQYWLERDRDGGFPEDFHGRSRSAGWLGIAMPQEYGGAGLGITEAALMMQAISESGAGFSGASAVHMNIFGLNPVVVFGTEEQKQRWLPPLIRGEEKACFAVTEPNAGLNTRQHQDHPRGAKAIATCCAGRRSGSRPRRSPTRMLILARTAPSKPAPKPTDGLVAVLHRPRPALRRSARDREDGPQGGGLEPAVHRGAAGAGGRPHRRRGQGLRLHPPRPQPRAHPDRGGSRSGSAAPRSQRAVAYANERVVFDRPIGQNQAIQHPLARCWMELEAANLMVFKAASLYDNGEPCGAEANAAKYLAAEACFRACETAMLTHGGMGYAKEYHVERYLREAMIPRLAPVSPQLILCFIAEKVLGLPKSY